MSFGPKSRLALRRSLVAGLTLVGLSVFTSTPASNTAAAQIAAPRTPSFPTLRTRDGREAAADHVVVRFRNRPRSDTVPVSAGASVEEMLQRLRADPRVLYAEPDFVVHALQIPNDPYFPEQWGMIRVQASAWNATHGSTGVRIGILDCGMYESGSTTRGPGHPDINGKVDLRQDLTGSTNGTDDICDHGTHVAGIAAASTNDDLGVVGLGWDSHLLNVKVLDDTGSGTDSWVASGMTWATDNGAKVINLSLGSAGSCSQTLQDAVNYAWTHNVVVVAAAGNSSSTSPFSPADCTNVVSVAATDQNDARWMKTRAGYCGGRAPTVAITARRHCRTTECSFRLPDRMSGSSTGPPDWWIGTTPPATAAEVRRRCTPTASCMCAIRCRRALVMFSMRRPGRCWAASTSAMEH